MTVRVASAVVLVLAVFGGWNWYWKNEYKSRLARAVSEHNAKVQTIQGSLDTEVKATKDALQLEHKKREEQLRAQIAEITSRPPSERVVYKLRDRWRPVSCPSPASGGVGGVEVGGIHQSDELALVRIAADADRNTLERNACVVLYNAARNAAISANKR